MTGTIKHLGPTFGFITAEDGSDYFFHEDDQLDDFDLRVGDRVAFEPVVPQPPKGPRAREVVWQAPS